MVKTVIKVHTKQERTAAPGAAAAAAIVLGTHKALTLSTHDLGNVLRAGHRDALRAVVSPLAGTVAGDAVGDAGRRLVEAQ